MPATVAKPCLLWWQMRSGVLLTSVLGPKALVDTALGRDNNGGAANVAVVRQAIPFGTTGWATSERGPWRPLDELPDDWGLQDVHALLKRSRGTWERQR